MAGINGHDELCLSRYQHLSNAADCVYCEPVKAAERRAVQREYGIDPSRMDDRWTTDWEGFPE